MNRTSISFIVVGLLIIGGILLLSKESQQRPKNAENNLIPVSSFTHAHGLAVDVADDTKLYIATHNGLFTLIDGKNLYQVGKKKDDYMGFSAHPTDPKIFFTSGHPSFGGNLGFQKSINVGISWEKISNGVGGPVDFHAMAVSQANPAVIYGWHKGLQRTKNEGKTWELLKTDLSQVISLTTDPKDENIVYATTPLGIIKSTDQGVNWLPLTSSIKSRVTSLAVNPKNNLEMLSFSDDIGLAKSTDSGVTWNKIDQPSFNSDPILYIAYASQNSNVVYALTQSNTLHSSSDSGTTWTKIR